MGQGARYPTTWPSRLPRKCQSQRKENRRSFHSRSIMPTESLVLFFAKSVSARCLGILWDYVTAWSQSKIETVHPFVSSDILFLNWTPFLFPFLALGTSIAMVLRYSRMNMLVSTYFVGYSHVSSVAVLRTDDWKLNCIQPFFFSFMVLFKEEHGDNVWRHFGDDQLVAKLCQRTNFVKSWHRH